MLVGVVSYSFAISSFSSILNSIDKRQARLKEKLDALNAIRANTDMDDELYWKMRQSLHYHHTTDMSDKLNLLSELPSALRISLSHVLYRG